jgi:hypothetical protein
MITRRSLPLAAAGLLSLISTSLAELPPDAYRRMQSAAPEELRITVQKVTIGRSSDKQVRSSSVSASARVEEVVRSAANLKPGDLIRISYEHRAYKMPMPGPSEPIIIKKGRSYPAFLRKTRDGRYGAAAGGYSFRKLD